MKTIYVQGWILATAAIVLAVACAAWWKCLPAVAITLAAIALFLVEISVTTVPKYPEEDWDIDLD